MKKKLLVLLIAAASTMMPNLASAVAIEIEIENDVVEGILPGRFPNGVN